MNRMQKAKQDAEISASLDRENEFWKTHTWEPAGPEHDDLYSDDADHVCTEDDSMCAKYMEDEPERDFPTGLFTRRHEMRTKGATHVFWDIHLARGESWSASVSYVPLFDDDGPFYADGSECGVPIFEY